MDRHQERATALAALVSDADDIDEQTRQTVDAYLRRKATLGDARVEIPGVRGARIVRDQQGIPHISADHPYDLFFAHGYAQAQDRLWQIDYLRRQAHGNLSEVFGSDMLDEDILSRTLGIRDISGAALEGASEESRDVFQAFADGVNFWMNHLPEGLPIEFELLDYEPSPWEPLDSVAIMRRWYWYLTGRLPVIATSEAVREGIGSLEHAFFQPDGETAYIVPSGNYEPDPSYPERPVAELSPPLWGPLDGVGSNNWAIAPNLAADGYAMVGSDPHVFYTVPADWYDAHLHGAGYDVIGMTYPGVPMLRFGRTPTLAWGITNNICLQRDLYVERINPANSSEYQDKGGWTPFSTRTSTISVRNGEDVEWTTRFAHGRPVVDHLLSEAYHPARLWSGDRGANTALSLAWVGFEASDEGGVLLDLNRSTTVEEGRQALSGWRCPTWNFVLADTEGSVAYQCTGAIPLRGREYRGYRDASNPEDAWQGYIPYEHLPHLVDPERGWVASANNPAAPPDFPYPLYGTWAVEDRAARAEQLLEERKPHDPGTFAAMQNDVFSGRASRGTPALIATLRSADDPTFTDVIRLLEEWDFELDVESLGGAVFYVFFWRWHERVVRTRFSDELVPLVVASGWGLSGALLHENDADWFESDDDRREAVCEAMREAIDWLGDRFGTDPSQWIWGDMHRLGAVHPVARTRLQHEVFDISFEPQPGGASTLSSAFYLPPGSFDTKTGASYRIIASLNPESTTQSVVWPGHSGHPGSNHYRDQVEMHKTGRYADRPFRWEDVEASASSAFLLEVREE